MRTLKTRLPRIIFLKSRPNYTLLYTILDTPLKFRILHMHDNAPIRHLAYTLCVTVRLRMLPTKNFIQKLDPTFWLCAYALYARIYGCIYSI